MSYARSLVDEQNWPSFKALEAARGIIPFLDHLTDVEDPFQSPLRTKVATGSKQLRLELKQLKKSWLSSLRVAPHPDLAVGHANRIAELGPFGNPYGAAAFWEAVVQMAPWAQQRGFVDDKALVDAIQGHFKRRVSEVNERIKVLERYDPVLHQGLEQAAQGMEQ